MPYINSDHLLSEIDELKKSPWFNRGNGSGNPVEEDEYYVRKDAVECVVDMCIKTEPAADVAPVIHAHWIRAHVSWTEDALICSRCQRTFNIPKHVSADIISETDPYCHCGAKMDEKEVE